MNSTYILNPPFSIVRGLTFKLRLNLKIFWILSFTLLAALLVSYIFQINALVEKTYRIQSYRQQINKIYQENENLRIKSVKNNSLSNIEVLIQNLGFEKIQDVHYIQILGSQVVKK
jgi:predicted PurR-regulated permease PerM